MTIKKVDSLPAVVIPAGLPGRGRVDDRDCPSIGLIPSALGVLARTLMLRRA
jgi:hypothetical protein